MEDVIDDAEGTAGDLEKTLDAIVAKNWRIVLLAPREKRPVGIHWTILTKREIRAIERHLKTGGNIGLVCGPDSGVAVLDFDEPGAMAEMCEAQEPIEPWVITGSGKFHCYVKWEENLPARIMWKGERVGEIQRGPALQHVVIPPSIHPKSKLSYSWLVDPVGNELFSLPESWRDRFEQDTGIPSYITPEAIGHPDRPVWEGPPPEEILRRAMSQPGARRRRNGVKFQCPGCRSEGHDKSKDNAIVYEDGRWGCALDSAHRKDIGEELGYSTEDVNLAKQIISDAAISDVMKKFW